MSADAFTIKQNDTREYISRTLKNSDGTVIDLTGASVAFHMWNSSAVKVDAAAVVTDAANGVCEYRWSAGDTDTAGVYRYEFEVTFGDGTVITVPNDQHGTVTVTEEGS